MKMISYSAVGAKRKSPGQPSKPVASSAWTPIGAPAGVRDSALQITSAPSYLASQPVRLLSALAGSESQAIPLLSGLHELKVRAQQVRKRQRVQLLASQLASPAAGKESFMFDASTLPARLAHLFPSVLSEQPSFTYAPTSAESSGAEQAKEPREKQAAENSYEEKHSRPLESLLSLADQQSPVHDESMASSQPSNEFETTLKHQQRVPIVNGPDADSLGASASSGQLGPSSGDSPDSDQPQAEHGDERESELADQRRPHAETNSGRPEVGAERELLVGPFKSESEAPNTITLSGIVYQKSGASSPFVRASLTKDERPPAEDKQGQQPDKQALAGAPDKRLPSATSQTHQIHQLPASLSELLANLKGANGGQLDAQLRDAMVQADSGRELAPPSQPASDNLQSASLKLSTSTSSPLSSMLLLSSLLNSGVQLDEDMMALLEPPRQLLVSAQPGPLLAGAKATKGALLAAAHEQAPIWASKKGEQYYLGAQLSATEPSPSVTPVAAASAKHKDKSGPIVIVQKDVKPVKYHLLKAYLKLRRLLRPFEATYVFPSDSSSLMRRRTYAQQPAQTQASPWPQGAQTAASSQAAAGQRLP